MPQQQVHRSGRNAPFVTSQHKKRSNARLILSSMIVLLIIVAGAVGIFVLIQHNTSPANQGSTGHVDSQGASSPGTPFSVSFSGPIHGALAISAVNLCGLESGTSTYEVDANGTIGSTTYEFTLLIPQYRGPGTYSTTGVSATASVTLNTPDNTDQWVSQGQTGTAIVSSDGQAGTISATIIHATGNGQELVTGTWSCG